MNKYGQLDFFLSGMNVVLFLVAAALGLPVPAGVFAVCCIVVGANGVFRLRRMNQDGTVQKAESGD